MQTAEIISSHLGDGKVTEVFDVREWNLGMAVNSDALCMHHYYFEGNKSCTCRVTGVIDINTWLFCCLRRFS